MKDNTVEKNASEEEQLKSHFLEIKVGFVVLDDEEQCVNECTDVDNVLQDVIASLCEGDNDNYHSHPHKLHMSKSKKHCKDIY